MIRTGPKLKYYLVIRLLFLGLMASLGLAIPVQAVRIMCLGDSITYGNFGTAGDAYLGYLRDRLASSGWSVEMFNRGYLGENSYNIDSHVLDDLTATDPEIVLYHIGTNDVSAGFSSTIIDANIRSTIDKALAYPTVRKVILAALIPRTAPLDPRTRTDELAQVQRDTALSLAEQARAVWLAEQNSTFLATARWETALMRDTKHPNSSGYQVMSEVWAKTLLDVTPPAAVADLEGAGIGDGQVALAWTAPGDDLTAGRAAGYLIRYSHDPIDAANWTSAALAAAVPAPDEPGSHETFTVTGLTAGAAYYFALRTRDEIGNFSGLSNLITAVAERDHALVDGAARLSERPLVCPNPFSPTAGAVKFVYKLTAESNIDIYVFNLALEQVYRAGYLAGANGGRIDLNEVTWDGRDSFGRLIPNGAYFVKITDGSRVLGTIKLAVIQ